MKRVLSIISAAAIAAAPLSASRQSAASPDGWLLWHSYSDYSAIDSRLYLRSPDGAVTEITGEFVHPMNGDFGSTPSDIMFMAIDKAADEWDIYRYNAVSGTCTNLTERSGFRNEDARFSPDGSHAVFKRGHWDSAADGFVYDLALLDLSDMSVTMLTDTPEEEAMPCFSPDGKYIYYALYSGGTSAICRLECETGESETIYGMDGAVSYYPVCSDEGVYFTRQYSPDNRCDSLMLYDGEKCEMLPFCTGEYDCSDACPTGSGGLVYSSSRSGSYDLYFYDGESSAPLDALNTAQNELGADYYGSGRAAEYLRNLGGYIIGADAPMQNYDTNGDGSADCFDLIYARRQLALTMTGGK